MDESLTLRAPAITAPRAFEHEHSAALGPDLAWLTSILWPGADVRLAPQRVPAGARVAEAYALVPNAARPELLVPFAAPSLAHRVSPRRDRRRSLVAAVQRSIASHIGGLRFPPLVVFFAREPRPDELLTQRLRSVFDRPDVTPVISWSGEGRERIPVVYAVTLEGELLGVAKVGWSDASRALVRHEAVALRRWDRRPARSFVAPHVIHQDMWEEHQLTVLSPTPVISPVRASPFESIDEIAQSGGVALTELASTPWWRSLLDRAAVDATLTVVLRWMHDLHGRRLMWHASSHGDWAPDNVGIADGRLHVSEWGRAGDGVPLGLDPVSFAVCRRSGAGRSSFRWRGVIAEAAPALRRFGVPEQDEGVLIACYLAERLVRQRQAAGGGSRPDGYENGLEELRRWVARA